MMWEIMSVTPAPICQTGSVKKSSGFTAEAFGRIASTPIPVLMPSSFESTARIDCSDPAAGSVRIV